MAFLRAEGDVLDQTLPSLCMCGPAGLAPPRPPAHSLPSPASTRGAELCAVSVQDKERLRRQLKLRAEKEEKEKLREEAKRAKEEARKKREEEKELKEKERREKREKDEKEKAEKQRLKEERRKERQEALECVPCPLHLGSHTLCSVPLSPYPTPSMGISTGLGQQVSLSVMSRRAKLEEKRKKEEEKRLREEEKVECVSRSRTFPCV